MSNARIYVDDNGRPVSRTSNHAHANRRPRTWHQDLRARRKRQRQARKVQRGK